MSARSDNKTPPDRLMEARFQQAFAELLRGSDYSDMTSCNIWDYAVEIAVLRRLGLSNNDVRVLVQKQLVEHAHEITQEDSNERSFRRTSGISFTERSCVVLTPLGVAKARYCASNVTTGRGPAEPHETLVSPGSPVWDAARRELYYGDRLVKQFRRPASNQEAVLSAFEEEGWPPQVLNPLPTHQFQTSKRRLSETIRSLNRGQAHLRIHFRGDGTGEGILWRPAVEAQVLRIPRLPIR